MNNLAALLDRLAYEPRRLAKLALLETYFRETPDPDRGWALAAITGALTFKHAKAALIRNLAAREPATLEVCTLLSKPDRLRAEVPIRYTGIEIPDEFVIGYGLDYAQKYRNLDHVATLPEGVAPPL